MIFFVVRRRHPYTIGEFLISDRADPALASRVRVVSYEALFSLPALPEATYVFCDHERLSTSELERLGWIWVRLQESGTVSRLLNHPFRVRRRYDLLQTLAQAGVNAYRAYRVTEPERPAQYPVFLRGENDHRGPCSELITNPAALEIAIRQRLDVKWRGESAEPTLIVEYCAEPDTSGHFMKYAAFRVGDRIIARHRFVSEHWAVKRLSVVDPRSLQQEYDFVNQNPHQEALREIFDAAHIDYGRIDYSVVDGRLQVYEINTNPMTVGWISPPERERTDALFAQRFCAALQAIDSPPKMNFVSLSGASRIVAPVPARVRKRVGRQMERDHQWSLGRSLHHTLKSLRPVAPYPSRILQIGRRQIRWLWHGNGTGLPFRLGLLPLVLGRLAVEILRSCWSRGCRDLSPTSCGTVPPPTHGQPERKSRSE